MTHRALLIGSETFGLSGCNADVALMHHALVGRGFTEIEVLIDQGATREGIVAGYERLIAGSATRDTVVVYYSGHGGRVALPDWEARQAAGREAFLQFVVPHDMALTTPEDFRGVLSLELSDLQSRLTGKTRNVTTILDCCHSGLMSRDAMLIPKALPRPLPYDGALARLAEIEARSPVRIGDGDLDAVRVVACAPTQSAFEGPSRFRPGERHGLLTDALANLLLVTGGTQTTWQTIAERLRALVEGATLAQRPEVEGPSQRVPFSLDEHDWVGALTVRVADGALWLEGAELLGVSPGDEYLLFDGDGHELGRAAAGPTICGRARLTPVDGEAWTALTAAPVRTSSRLPVAIELGDLLRASMIAAVEASRSLLVSPTGAGIIGSVKLDDGLIVSDSAGLALHRGPLEVGETGTRQAVALLEQLARAHRFRALRQATGGSRLTQRVEVCIARHDDDGTRRLIRSGERLFVGDRLSLTVQNLGDAPLFYWLFDIGIASSIELVTQASPSGRELSSAGKPGDIDTFGGPSGPGLVWSESLPADGGRQETFVVIVADRAQDLSSLRSRESPRDEPRSRLQLELEQASDGVRNWPAEATPARLLSYRVDTWDVILEPSTRPRLDEPAFALDERPDLSLRLLTPRGGSSPPKKVAVRLESLSVRSNRALFRATVRLDAMVITADRKGRAIATPVTQRFPGIANGDLLPMDNLRLYVGPVREFLDIAIWVNRDDDKGVSLADLFADEMSKSGVKSALTVVGGLVVAAPAVAAGVGAVVAVAELVRVGARLVSAVVGKNIGLYRTSLLPHERFGIGRHPEKGMQEAQAIRFAYDVREQL
jgi:Caspase domain